jgi:hypothetical protein
MMNQWINGSERLVRKRGLELLVAGLVQNPHKENAPYINEQGYGPKILKFWIPVPGVENSVVPVGNIHVPIIEMDNNTH